jgi:hypothetical protein
LTLIHQDCPGGRIVLPAQPSPECDLHCALCGERTVVDQEQLLQEVKRLLTSATGTRAVVASLSSGVVEITWEAPARRVHPSRKRYEGERKTFQITIIVLVLVIVAFVLCGMYFVLDGMGAFDAWNKGQRKGDVSSGGR